MKTDFRKSVSDRLTHVLIFYKYYVILVSMKCSPKAALFEQHMST